MKSVCVSAIVALTSCADTPNALGEPTIRVLSYNMHHGAGTDGQLDLKRIADVIRSVSPDVVSLQEVDNKVRRSKQVDQAKELARLTDMSYIFGSSIRYGGGQYGNAVLTKLPVQNSETIALPGKEKRSALCVMLKTSRKISAGTFVFIATHLDLASKVQLASVDLINKRFNAENDIPAVLAGDLNARPKSLTINRFEKYWENATRKDGFYTYPAKNPEHQIDYVLYRPSQGFVVLETKVLDEPVASDHRPILAVLQLGPEFMKQKVKTTNKPDPDDGN